MDIIWNIFVILLGLIFGSFFNVCIYRMPREQSLIKPASSCPQCGKAIAFYDNIPLISYLVLRGKCRKCGTGISIRYPIIEVLTAVIYFLLYRKFGFNFDYYALLLFVSAIIIIAFVDIDYQIIPDVLSLGGIVAGFVLSFFRPMFSYLDSLIGIAVGGGILLAIAYGYQLIARREGMGGGDIKLLAMIGAFCGWKGVVFSLISGSVFGVVTGIPMMLLQKKDMKYAIPFGPFLALGSLLYIFQGERIIFYVLDMLYG